jgi:hypothetical protein
LGREVEPGNWMRLRERGDERQRKWYEVWTVQHSIPVVLVTVVTKLKNDSQMMQRKK